MRDVGHHVQVVVDLVVHLPVRRALGDRAVAIGEVELHRPFEPLRRAVAPRAADDGLEPVRIARHRARRESRRARRRARGTRSGSCGPAPSMLPASCLWRMRTSVSSSWALVGKRIAARRLRAALVEQRHPVLEKPRIVVRPGRVRLRAGADEDAQRLRRSCGGAGAERRCQSRGAPSRRASRGAGKRFIHHGGCVMG